MTTQSNLTTDMAQVRNLSDFYAVCSKHGLMTKANGLIIKAGEFTFFGEDVFNGKPVDDPKVFVSGQREAVNAAVYAEEEDSTMTTQDIINTINKAAPSYSDETIHVRLYGVADGWDFHIDAKEYAEEGGLRGWLEVYTELDPETVAEITNHDWMFVDWEGALVSHCISEWSFDCDQYKALVESELDPEILEAGLECNIPLEHIADAYAGSYESDEDYAQSLAEDCGDIPEHLWNYIDWERYARDICMDMYSSNGHYFHMNW